ncbi:MAG: hypothetical protein HZA35_00350, partial [Parcubacteria group bacterium]|nr:hypothetical protein [Parcubacteria group bacterium]
MKSEAYATPNVIWPADTAMSASLSRSRTDNDLITYYHTSKEFDGSMYNGFSLVRTVYAADSSGDVLGAKTGRGLGCAFIRNVVAPIGRAVSSFTRTRLWQMMPVQRRIVRWIQTKYSAARRVLQGIFSQNPADFVVYQNAHTLGIYYRKALALLVQGKISDYSLQQLKVYFKSIPDELQNLAHLTMQGLLLQGEEQRQWLLEHKDHELDGLMDAYIHLFSKGTLSEDQSTQMLNLIKRYAKYR